MEKNRQQFPELFFEKLIGILKEESNSLQLLCDNLEEQYQVLLNQQLGEFLQVLDVQRSLVWEIQVKDKIRQEELRAFLPQPENQSLRDIIKIAPPAFKTGLEELKAQFDRHVKTIERLKVRNQLLIQKSLELIQKQVDHFRGPNRSGYTATGTLENDRASLFCRHI